MQQRMKAAIVEQQGAASFKVTDVEVPSPELGQVLIKVESAGVNFSDVKRRRGDLYPFQTSFPFIPGGEIAGTIEALGPGVAALQVGTRVFALAGANGFGGYAQYAVAYASTVHPVPPPLSSDAASVLVVAGSTAKVMLKLTANLRQRETIFIPAATGGVGSFAVPLAKTMGAHVIAGVGDDSKRERALALGADDAVNYAKAGWAEQVRRLTDGKGVDVALEASGGDALEETLKAAGSFARIIVYGSASGVSATLSQSALDRLFYDPIPNQTLTGFGIGSWFMERPAEAGAALGELVHEVLSGTIPMPKIHPLPLSKVQEAHTMLESRQVTGKIVLKPWLS